MRCIITFFCIVASILPGAQAENMVISAYELIAIVEVGGSECQRLNLASTDQMATLKNFVAGLLKRHTYQEYLSSAAFETARTKGVEDIRRNGFDPTLCTFIFRLPSMPPDQIMFVEPGK